MQQPAAEAKHEILETTAPADHPVAEPIIMDVGKLTEEEEKLYNALEDAIQESHLPVVQLLLEQVPEMTIFAALFAVKEGQLEIVKYLILQDPDLVTYRDSLGNTMLFYAIDFGIKDRDRFGYVRHSLSSFEASLNGSFDDEALDEHSPARFEVADFLLKNGADLNASKPDNLLNKAIYPSAVEYLAEKIAQFGTIELKNKALCQTVYHRLQYPTKLLLASGADIDHVQLTCFPSNEETLLACAIRKLSLSKELHPIIEEHTMAMVGFLLQNGAHPEQVGPGILKKLRKTIPELIVNYHFIKAQKYIEQQKEVINKIRKKLPRRLWDILSRALSEAAPPLDGNEELMITIHLIKKAGQKYKNAPLELLALCKVAEEMLGVSINYCEFLEDAAEASLMSDSNAAARAQGYSLSALEDATANNRRGMMAFLLGSGARIGNALQIAISDHPQSDLAEFLIITAKEKGRIDAFHLALLKAAIDQHLTAVILLLDYIEPTKELLNAIAESFNDSDVKDIFSRLKRSEHKELALCAAIYYGRFSAAEDLIQKGVDIDHNVSGQGAPLVIFVHQIDSILKNPNIQLSNTLKALWTEKLQFLLAQGANPQVLNRYPAILQLLGEKTNVKITFNYHLLFKRTGKNQVVPEKEKYLEHDYLSQAQELREMLLESLRNAEKLSQSQPSFFKSSPPAMAVIQDISAIGNQKYIGVRALRILIDIAKEAGIEVKPSIHRSPVLLEVENSAGATLSK
ncbi:MAG: hypothetical protein K0Q74_533 [Gammaproteobacteria bacterium]|jgi:ankyrin repeat protein|nr:hypothetical protein [Gammaproteobacteria bacterium]